MIKVLLIGGEGFIGNRFVELSTKIFNCTTWDIKSNQNINLDIPREKRDRIGGMPVLYDTVIFLAARPNLKSLLEHTKDGFRTATRGLQNALRQYQDCHFIYISSSMVYGDWTGNTMSETDLCSPNNMLSLIHI